MSLSTTQYGYIVDPMVPFTDDKGKTIKNGFIRVFMAGTSTPVLTYRNYDGATNQEKIELDNSGRVKHNVIGSKGSLYKVVVYNILHSQENPLLTVDKIAVLGASINASGATIVTGLDSVTVQEDNFLKATVEGTSVELALDPTEVTSDVNTISAAETAAPDYVLPLLDKTGTGDCKKISLANLFKFALDWISRLATTVTSFASGDFIAVSNTTNGARKMSKDTLLELTAQNALAGNVASAFSSSVSYSNGRKIVYEGKLYRFKADHPAGPWSSSDVELIDVDAMTTQKFYNGGLANIGNLNKVRTCGIAICNRGSFSIKINRPLDEGHYYTIGYALTANILAVGNSLYAGKYDVWAPVVEDIAKIHPGDVFDFSTRPTAKVVAFEICERDENGTVVPLRYTDFYGYSVEIVPYDNIPKIWGSLGNGKAVAYLAGATGGELVFDYRTTAVIKGAETVYVTGRAFVSFTNASNRFYKAINYIQYPQNLPCPFVMLNDGTRTIIRNVTGHSVEIAFISTSSSWKLPIDGFNDPAGWNEASASEIGSINDILADTIETADKTIDFSVLPAMARYHVESASSHDFTTLIVSDSHGDNKSVNRAVKYGAMSEVIDGVVHCGDWGDTIALDAVSTPWAGYVASSRKNTYFVVGNHEKGTYPNVQFTPSDSVLYNLFVKPLVDKGYLAVGEYAVDKCYYYHDFAARKIRLIVLDEYLAPKDYDETYWKAIVYDSTLPEIANNTSYSQGSKVNVPGFTSNSFEAVQAVNSGAYSSNYRPRYKCIRGYRYIDQTEAQWFLDTLYTTPSGYGVVVAMHNPFSDLAIADNDCRFSQLINRPEVMVGADYSQNYLATDFIANAINAFVTGANYTETVSTKQTSAANYIADYSVSKDFSSLGAGKFLGYVGGHIHKDIVWRHPTYEGQIQICVMTSCTTSQPNNKNCDIRLLADTYEAINSDSLTSVSFSEGRLGLAKLGIKYTLDGRVRDTEIIT